MSKKIRWVNQKRGDRRTRKIKLDVIKNDASHVIRGRRTEHCERERSGISPWPVVIVNAAAVSVFVRGSSIQYVYIYICICIPTPFQSGQNPQAKVTCHGLGRDKNSKYRPTYYTSNYFPRSKIVRRFDFFKYIAFTVNLNIVCIYQSAYQELCIKKTTPSAPNYKLFQLFQICSFCYTLNIHYVQMHSKNNISRKARIPYNLKQRGYVL